jgi:hypothetical protein
MEYRWVEEADPTCQCLLQLYASVALATKYNDFDIHLAETARGRR